MGFYISAPQSSLLLCSTGNLLSFLFWGSEALDRATDVCVQGTSTESEGLMEEGYGRRSGGGIFHLNLPDSGHLRDGGFSFVRMLSERCQRKRSPDASSELGENKQVTAQNSLLPWSRSALQPLVAGFYYTPHAQRQAIANKTARNTTMYCIKSAIW